MKVFKRLFGLAFVVLLIGAAAWIVLNREWLYDYWRGMSYQPSSEMSEIRKKLNLTERGEFLFNASQPELNQKDDFNDNCSSDSVEIAILGCYRMQNIYVYDIEEKKLDGIREVTTAHELLHAVFARMSEGEKEALKSDLEKVYKDNQGVLADDLKTYAEGARFEELYVRAGTEVKDLPSKLEKHYAEIFKDQDAVVGYYDSYNTVFRQLRAELEQLEAEMERINNGIEAKTQQYEQWIVEFDGKVSDFNNCAMMAGCFGSEAEFQYERANLLNEQEAINALYDEVEALVTEYNQKVNIYNADVTETQKLNDKMNSNAKPKEIK